MPVITISEAEIPCAANPLLQSLLDTYVSESNKVADTWRRFSDADLGFKPHERSTSVRGILQHQLLSERRFFAEFLGLHEPAPEELIPGDSQLASLIHRYVTLVKLRLPFLSQQTDEWWIQVVPFFDVQRQRMWIFWRRLLHTAHHRAQLTVYLRLLDRAVPAIYGPSADETWDLADPTFSIEAARRQ